MPAITFSLGGFSLILPALWPPRAAVGVLQLPSRPAAILGRVVSVAVDAIKGHTFRALSHVGEEVLEATSLVNGEPTVADGNASPSVVGVRGVRLLVAAVNHRHPRAIGWASAKAVRGTGGAQPLFDRGGVVLSSARAIVAGDEETGATVMNGGHLSATTSARLGQPANPLSVTLHEPLPILVTEVGRPRNAFATTTRAQRSFRSMPSQHEWSFVSEQVLRGNFFSTSTATLHDRSLTQRSRKGE